jgi:sucrose-6-phosphate hydrolase SacC (GH32 family)
MQASDVRDHIRAARELREQLWADPHRPRYHLMPPEGFFNDANGALFWKGRYHLFYLARSPIPDPEQPGAEKWVEVWDHASSRDLVHWTFHPPALRPALDGSTPRGIYSGGAVANAPRPTLIYHVPGQGTYIATSDDGELAHWTPLPQNPVIPIPREPQEYTVFDPCAWYEDGAYYALIGNRNARAGYEGDCTSLFRSTNMLDWEYLGPFYRSERRWTAVGDDCACPDFFPLGRKHMLLMHDHWPFNHCHYYLGRCEGRRFYPETYGQMSWPGGQLAGPETLADDQGRRIFFGWIYEARTWEEHGWASVMSLPRVLSLGEDGSLRIEPAPELEVLRHQPREWRDVALPAGQDVDLENLRGDCLELTVEIEPGTAAEVGVMVRCSPAGEEQTPIVCARRDQLLRIELARSTLDPAIRYPRFASRHAPEGLTESERYTQAQEAPLSLESGEPLRLRIFLDRSVLEVFANGRQCLTQRIYPSRSDSLGVRLFARGAAATARVQAWSMMPATPW